MSSAFNRTPRFNTDRFVPAVLATATTSIGGRVVDISATGARLVAGPTPAPPPRPNQEARLGFARSDGNREIDMDGVVQQVHVVDIRELPGARVCRLAFVEPVSPRLLAWVAGLSRLARHTESDDLPEFDPDVWAGWAAISPGTPESG